MTSPQKASFGSALRTALISPDPSFRTVIMRCLEETAPAAEWVLLAESDVTELRPENVDVLVDRRPDLLFVDVGTSPSAGVRFISAVTGRLPGVNVVAAGGGLGVDELLEIIRAGASGYLRRPWNRDEVFDVCSNLLRKLPTQPLEGQPVEAVGPSHVIALFAPKGGTGASTVAANLAVHIRKATAKKTLLLDLAPELGTAPVLLGMEARYTYHDVVEGLQRMDERLLHSFLDEHESGVWVLSSPATAASARELAPANVASLLRLMRNHFEYVVVDLGRGVIDDASLKALELADERLAVATAELPTLRNVKQALSYLPTEEDEKRAIKLVVNRYDEGVSVPAKDVERAVGLPLFEVIPEDRERVTRSANLGRPVVMGGSSPFAKAVRHLGDRLAADDLAGKQRSGLGGLLRNLVPQIGRRGETGPSRSDGRARGGGSTNGTSASANGVGASRNGERPAAKRPQPSRLPSPQARGSSDGPKGRSASADGAARTGHEDGAR